MDALLDCLLFWIYDIAKWAAEHKERPRETVGALGRRGKAVYVFGRGRLENKLELWRGGMVTFVADNETVIANELLGYRLSGLAVFARQRLKRSDVDEATYGGFAPSYLSDDRRLSFADSSFWSSDGFSVVRNVEELLELRSPLSYERGLGNDDKRWKANGGNKVSPNDCFTEACRRGHDSIFVSK